MWKTLGIILILIIIAATLTIYRSSPNNKPQLKPQDFNTPPSPKSTLETSNSPKAEVIAQNLEVPWALVFLPNKDILVTERAGGVRIIKNGKLEEKPLITLSQVKQVGESGLHGIAIHPDYPQKPFVYLYYTYSSSEDSTLNRVSRFTLEDNNLKNEQVIVDKIPGAIFHDGGRIKFGPDKNLYITTGDAQNPSLAQNKDSLAGKILRISDEGKAAPGNPFNNLVYSYGHRNPQGLAWGNDGRLWETEHGNNATDEINVIYPGQNYGWPKIQGDQMQEGMEKPFKNSGTSTWAPAGAAIFDNTLYFAGLRGSALFSIDIKSDLRLVVTEKIIKENFKGQFGRIRDVVLGPDNMLYITTSNRDGRGSPSSNDDRIIRINPTKI